MVSHEDAASEFSRLVQIIAHLRGEHGCPWDKEQTHASLKPCLIEETYEVCDAIDAGSSDKLREELGDLLMQAVMHAQLADEAGKFNIGDVLKEIAGKLIRRHPHVFHPHPDPSPALRQAQGDLRASKVASGRRVGGEGLTPDDVLKRWEKIKQHEGGDAARSLMDGIPQSLPALMTAQKVQDKFARVGFDWPGVDGAIEKVREELEELLDARDTKDASDAGDTRDARMEEEIGDLLFAVVNVARLLQTDAEQALKSASQKAANRFRIIEDVARHQQRDVRDMTLEEMEAIWNSTKEK